MGYRSDIGLCLSQKAKQALDRMCAKNSDKRRIDEFLDEAKCHTHTESQTIAYHWTWTKWYTEFVEIAFLEKFMENLDDTEYLFIRIGESYDDVEYKGSFWENPLNMGLQREVSFD